MASSPFPAGGVGWAGDVVVVVLDGILKEKPGVAAGDGALAKFPKGFFVFDVGGAPPNGLVEGGETPKSNFVVELPSLPPLLVFVLVPTTSFPGSCRFCIITRFHAKNSEMV